MIICLTERQLGVLIEIAKGATYKEAGRTLGISNNTVLRHAQRMVAANECKNVTELAVRATLNGIITRRDIQG